MLSQFYSYPRNAIFQQIATKKETPEFCRHIFQKINFQYPRKFIRDSKKLIQSFPRLLVFVAFSIVLCFILRWRKLCEIYVARGWKNSTKTKLATVSCFYMLYRCALTLFLSFLLACSRLSFAINKNSLFLCDAIKAKDGNSFAN